MTPEQISLAKRAIASKWWKWLPGMLVTGEDWSEVYRIVGGQEIAVETDSAWHCYAGWSNIPFSEYEKSEALPDFSDPATLGCLLFLVRQAYKAPWIDVVCESANDPDYVWRVNLDNNCFRATSEAEALIMALEAAP